jgi:threonine/homoserine/homoserine lactone efflux protein
MLTALGTVIITSLSGVMMPGPMFAVTLTKSYKSPWAGVQLALGHAVIEIPLILVIYFGIAQFFQNIWVQLALSIIGGGMIAWIGIGLFRARKKAATGGADTPYNAFVAGILMSGLNPFFLVWWVTIGSLLLMQFIASTTYLLLGLVLFITAHWICDLVWLSFVSVTVHKTHSFWGPRVQEGVFIAMSLLLFFFAGWFIVSGIGKVI